MSGYNPRPKAYFWSIDKPWLKRPVFNLIHQIKKNASNINISLSVCVKAVVQALGGTFYSVAFDD